MLIFRRQSLNQCKLTIFVPCDFKRYTRQNTFVSADFKHYSCNVSITNRWRVFVALCRSRRGIFPLTRLKFARSGEISSRVFHVIGKVPRQA